jgi:PadR family transcriptional regulator, regulatory protein AphA
MEYNASMKKELTTTSYAILGLLALRSWTTYELAKQMQRTLHYFWPRAESRLYDEPKNLVAHGLACAEKTFVGRRPRTTYTITPMGQQALSAWLATPSAGPLLESEAIVRVFCAVHGTKAQLLTAIASIRTSAEAMQAHGAQIAQEYRAGTMAFPTRIHTNALMFNFLWQYSEALVQWAAAAEATVGEWDDLSPEGKQAWAAQIFAQPMGRYGQARAPEGERVTPEGNIEDNTY